jgi:hypothetical protein
MTDDGQPLAFHYEMLGYYSQATIDASLSRFRLVSIPTGKIEKAFIYVKRYPKDFLKKNDSGVEAKSAYAKMKQLAKPQANANKVVVGPKIQVKTFENPFTAKESDKPDYSAVSQKIAAEFPENRTALAVNFDKQYPDDLIKKVFGVMGQIRRVFSGTVGRKGEDGGR